MDVREQKQEEYSDIFVGKKRGILLLSLRFGKTRCSLLIKEKLKAKRVLICYPEISIAESWREELKKMELSDGNITFSAFASLHKLERERWDLVIVDECHKLSDRNISSLKLLEPNTALLGLTGSLDADTRKKLREELKMPVIASYDKEDAIEDGIIADYRINIITVPLDNQRLIQYKKKRRTEKAQFNAYTAIINNLRSQGKDTMFLNFARMRIIQNSISKMEITRKLLKKFKEDRILVFCGLIKIAEKLGIPVHHSKSESDELSSFKKGEGNHLAVIRIGMAGITYSPLNKVVINYFSSSGEDLQQKIGRALNLEFEGQCAEIYIITSNESVESNWLRKALSSFNQEKVNYNYKF